MLTGSSSLQDEKDKQVTVYEIKRILAERAPGGKRQYFIRWEGFDENGDTWEPEANVLQCADLIKEFNICPPLLLLNWSAQNDCIVGNIYGHHSEPPGAEWHTNTIDDKGIQTEADGSGIRFVVTTSSSRYLLAGKPVKGKPVK